MRKILNIFCISFLSILVGTIAVTPAYAESSSDNYVTIDTWEDVDVLIEMTDNFKLENPDASIEDIENFTREAMMSDIFAERPEIAPLFLYQYNALTKQEKALAIAHPSQLLAVRDAAKTATNETIALFGFNHADDESDAYRHIMWSALISSKIGQANSNIWTTAHESESSGLAKEMDLYNNRLGRINAIEGTSLSNIKYRAYQLIKTGSARRILGGKLVPTKL